MKTSIQLLSVLSNVAALASAIFIPRQASGDSGNFTISNIYFGGNSQNSIVSYGFDVEDTYDGKSTHCSNAIDNNGDISPFGLTACDDPQWSFAWPQVQGPGSAYALQIERELIVDGHISKNETTCTTYDSSRIGYVVDGTDSYQFFNFPTTPLVQPWTHSYCTF